MKHNNALLHGCLLAAGLTLLPFAAHATGLSNHFLAENSFTQSVKDGYQDIKKEVKETVDELTGDDKTDTQKFQERRDKDLKKYQKEVRDAQKDYAKKREKAQREYLKHHKQLPFQEDLQKDLEVTPMPRPSGAFLYLPPKARPDKTGRSVCPGPFSIQRTPA